jgi:N-acetylmuramic acid 6-phosphate etherase
MVDMRARNAKLRRRAVAIVRQIAGCPEDEATRYLDQADGDLKTAIMVGLGLSRDNAIQMLKRHSGNLRGAIDEFKRADR